MKTYTLLLTLLILFTATQAVSVSMDRDIYPLQRSVKILESELKALTERVTALEQR